MMIDQMTILFEYQALIVKVTFWLDHFEGFADASMTGISEYRSDYQCITPTNKPGEMTALTDQNSITYTKEQVERIVELVLQNLVQSGETDPPLYLDKGISQQALPGTRMTVTVSEAAEMIGISRPKVYDLIRDGELPALKAGKKIVILKQAVLEWLSGG